MSTEAHDDVGLVPPGQEAPSPGYMDDFYSWALAQARLLRARELDAIDWENVAEEIESLGREQFNKLESAFRVLLMHMLKWDQQPERRSRSWALSIARQRLELDDVLSDNPGLKPRRDEALARAYKKARLEAAQETGLDLKRFPAACPYSTEDMTSRSFSHEDR